MRRALILFVLIFLGLLSACGNKGDLYLPPAVDKAPEPTKSAPAPGNGNSPAGSTEATDDKPQH
jgi:predicted small lipoprotein YifL